MQAGIGQRVLRLDTLLKLFNFKYSKTDVPSHAVAFDKVAFHTVDLPEHILCDLYINLFPPALQKALLLDKSGKEWQSYAALREYSIQIQTQLDLPKGKVNSGGNSTGNGGTGGASNSNASSGSGIGGGHKRRRDQHFCDRKSARDGRGFNQNSKKSHATKPRLPQPEFDFRMKSGRCTNCGQSGHVAKNCRSKFNSALLHKDNRSKEKGGSSCQPVFVSHEQLNVLHPSVVDSNNVLVEHMSVLPLVEGTRDAPQQAPLLVAGARDTRGG